MPETIPDDEEMERLMSSPVRNPRYAGATMADVARALHRRKEPRDGDLATSKSGERQREGHSER